MRVFVGLPLAVALLVLGAGPATTKTSPKHGAAPNLLVLSRWSSPLHSAPHVQIVSGALASEPGFGFVLFEEQGQAPNFFTTPKGEGALRLVRAGRMDWVFETKRGRVFAIETDCCNGAAFYDLGPRLDPNRLPPLPSHGIAVPIVYGPAHTNAVMLLPQAGYGETPYGFVSGFRLPEGTSPDQALHRPLLGPGGVLFRIDRRTHRLIAVGSGGRPAAERGIGLTCSHWPQRDGSAYVACPTTIRQVDPDGSGHVIFRQPPQRIEVTWPFLAPPPVGRTLLLQENFSSCGSHPFAFFLVPGANQLTPLGLGYSEPIGWASKYDALVVKLGGGEECGPSPTAIYDVEPEGYGGYSALVVATNVGDATTW